MTRTLNVIRMQFVNRQTYVWMPLIILGGSFVLSFLIFAIIPTDAALTTRRPGPITRRWA